MNLSDLVLIYLRKNACGRAHARNAVDIASVVESTERAVRAAVHDLRATGVPIASSVEPPSGFYVPATRDEADACSGHLWARVKEIAEVARRFDAATALMGLRPGNLKQLSLFEDERKVYRNAG
jgi:hypothetical protein